MRTVSLFTAILMVVLTVSAAAQEISVEAADALDEWRMGVIAYNQGLPGKSLLSMERAVSLNPTDPLIREWLGRAYWKSGMEYAALEVWDKLIEEKKASVYIQRMAGELRARFSGENTEIKNDEWIALTSIHGIENDFRYFQRPSSARSPEDGSGTLIITSYADGEIIVINANGKILEKFEGGVEGFDRPFDVLPLRDGRLLVSEFQKDRISVVALEGLKRGYRLETWGKKGDAPDEFLGPQYMALSPDGNFVFVSDWGNRRISKWTVDGKHVLNIEKTALFDGFSGPSGIACYGDRVYVADSLRAEVDVFDLSGNYIGVLADEGLEAPEGLSVYEGNLLIADQERVMKVNLKTGEMSVEAQLGEGEHRITSVFPDENGNLAVADFNGNQVVLLTPLSTLYSGVDVTLDSINASAFPDITVDLTVRDKKGRRLCGLDESNFIVYDGQLAKGDPDVIWSSSTDHSVSVCTVLDLSGTEYDAGNLLQGVTEMASALKSGDEFSITGAGAGEVIYDLNPDNEKEIFNNLKNSAAGSSSIQWDRVLRLAATKIASHRNRKTVVAFVNKEPAPDSFDNYGLIETARLMVNNGIVFNVVYGKRDFSSRELDYIVRQTGGVSDYLFKPEGCAALIRDFRNTGAGRYTLKFRSSRSSDFSRKFLPVAVEVLYINKSGRGESGFFAPLK